MSPSQVITACIDSCTRNMSPVLRLKLYQRWTMRWNTRQVGADEFGPTRRGVLVELHPLLESLCFPGTHASLHACSLACPASVFHGMKE